jgi:hypothetical protein
MSLGPLHDELSGLRAEVAAAYPAWVEAKRRRERDQHVAAREVVGDLAAFRDAVLHKKPGTAPVGEQPAAKRELTIAVCRAVEENPDLVLNAVGNSDDLRIEDLSIESGFKEADVALLEARRAADHFETANQDGLRAESDAAEMNELREAFARNDLAAVRAGLTG